MGITRRSFLFGTLFSFLPSEALAREALKIEYEAHESKLLNRKELSLKVPLRSGVSYALLSQLYTDSEKNALEIQKFNDNKKILYDKKIRRYAYIPQRLLRPILVKILKEDKYTTFEIDDQGEEGIKTLWDVAQFLNPALDISLRIILLLILNDEINPIKKYVYEGQKILVAESLLNQQKIKEEEPVPKLAIPVQKTDFQNPFRKNTQEILERLKAKDLYNSDRIRSNKKGWTISKHKGLDLVSPVGTPLYPINEGIVLRAEKDKKRWRNGNIVQYQTKDLEVTYCHLSEILVKTGEKITKETCLGKLGVSGNASKDYPHVHIQIKLKGKTVDPKRYILGN